MNQINLRSSLMGIDIEPRARIVRTVVLYIRRGR